MASPRHLNRKNVDESAEAGRNAIRQALGATSLSLSAVLDASIVGIAIYDGNSRCVVLNKVLASMNGTSPKAHVGKTIRQSFGDDALQVEPAFQHVLTSGKPLHDVELTVCLPGRSEKTHFVLNLYPLRDSPGDIRFIGVLFYEITNKKKLQSWLRDLNDSTRKLAPGEDKLSGGECMEHSARSMEMLQQSIELLNCSMALQCQISEMRVVAALRRVAPFSAVPQENQSILNSGALKQKPVPNLSVSPDSHGRGEHPTDCPSHREQQVIQLLAEGNSNKEVAALLNLSIRTVENYRARLMVKLHLHSAAELVRYAVRHKLVKA